MEAKTEFNCRLQLAYEHGRVNKFGMQVSVREVKFRLWVARLLNRKWFKLPTPKGTHIRDTIYVDIKRPILIVVSPSGELTTESGLHVPDSNEIQQLEVDRLSFKK